MSNEGHLRKRVEELAEGYAILSHNLMNGPNAAFFDERNEPQCVALKAGTLSIIAGQLRTALKETAKPITPPRCRNCRHPYGAHDGWHMLGASRKDWTPVWGSSCGFEVDFHHTCACPKYVPREEAEEQP